MRYFEDVTADDRVESEGYFVTAAEIKDFAKKYDPQPFHLDEDAARDGPFGALAASGWHTLGIMMRLMVLTKQETDSMPGLPSPGFEDLEWLHPVYQGDTVRVVSTVKERRASRTKPTGIVKFENQVLNQNDVVVLRVLTIGRYPRRDA